MTQRGRGEHLFWIHTLSPPPDLDSVRTFSGYGSGPAAAQRARASRPNRERGTVPTGTIGIFHIYTVPRQPPSSSSPTPKASNAKGTMHPPGIFGSRSSTHARIVLVVRTSPGEHRDAPRRSAQTRHLDWAIRGDCGHFSIPQLPTGVFSRGAQSNYGSTILGL